jgi:multisubunit Na+/H+ antiporter MnhF subunit
MSAVITISFALIAIGTIATLVRMLLGPTLADRIVATDLLLTMLVVAAAVESARSGEPVYLVVMVIVAVVGFLGTASVARYMERRGP